MTNPTFNEAHPTFNEAAVNERFTLTRISLTTMEESLFILVDNHSWDPPMVSGSRSTINGELKKRLVKSLGHHDHIDFDLLADLVRERNPINLALKND